MRILPQGKKIVLDDGSKPRTLVEVEQDAELLYVLSILGGKKKKEIEVRLLGPGAKVRVLGVFLGSDDDEFDILTIVHHRAPQTQGETRVFGALKGNGHCLFKGMIMIDKTAQKSQGQLVQRTLLLSDKAKAESLPYLEIEANDVRAGHAVAVSKIDPEQLFYLQSRGLGEKEARQLLVKGFLSQVIQEIPAPGVDKIETRLARKLGRW